jgi:hypothetical protein
LTQIGRGAIFAAGLRQQDDIGAMKAHKSHYRGTTVDIRPIRMLDEFFATTQKLRACITTTDTTTIFTCRPTPDPRVGQSGTGHDAGAFDCRPPPALPAAIATGLLEF